MSGPRCSKLEPGFSPLDPTNRTLRRRHTHRLYRKGVLGVFDPRQLLTPGTRILGGQEVESSSRDPDWHTRTAHWSEGENLRTSREPDLSTEFFPKLGYNLWPPIRNTWSYSLSSFLGRGELTVFPLKGGRPGTKSRARCDHGREGMGKGWSRSTNGQLEFLFQAHVEHANTNSLTSEFMEFRPPKLLADGSQRSLNY